VDAALPARRCRAAATHALSIGERPRPRPRPSAPEPAPPFALPLCLAAAASRSSRTREIYYQFVSFFSFFEHDSVFYHQNVLIKKVP
jgi:hypothetical protein